MLTIYFSGTGNTKYIAELFSRKMGAKCLSIEDEAECIRSINAHEIITFCYPIYGSRVPRNMREFVLRHMDALIGKKIIIIVTQALFSGDGARVFTDMFDEGTIDVVYAEHFYMPNNICNVPLLRKPGDKTIRKYLAKADAKMDRTCQNINDGIAVKRGFSRLSRVLGNIQGLLWQGSSKRERKNRHNPEAKPAPRFTAEQMLKNSVKIRKNCTVCSICVSVCPVQNFEESSGAIKTKGNCVMCYRCVNRCPSKAITVMIPRRPRWQYGGVALEHTDIES